MRFWSHFGSKRVTRRVPFGHHFRPKGAKRGVPPMPGNAGERPAADLGAIWCRKRSKVTFSSIWARFWSILEGSWKDFEQVWMIFLWFVMDCWCDFWVNSSIKFFPEAQPEGSRYLLILGVWGRGWWSCNRGVCEAIWQGPFFGRFSRWTPQLHFGWIWGWNWLCLA